VVTDVSGAYRSLIRARLKDSPCPRCGHSLENATLVAACEGTTLDEYGLSDRSAAAVLAATELLTVQCGQCGGSCDLGVSLASPPEPPLCLVMT
jgi:hypothetical protein